MDNNLNYSEINNKNLIKNNIDLINLLKNIKPLSFILYGSYAKNKQNINSDIDLMIVFKKKDICDNFNQLIITFKNNIHKIFKKKIDLVVMIYQKKLQYFEFNFDHDTNFIYNVFEDGYVLYGNNDKDLILESIKYGKF